MTGAERTTRWRFTKKLMNSLDGQRRNLWENLPPDMLGYQLAVSLFDFRHGRSDLNRWNQIATHVYTSLAELEREFA